ncbi:MAG: class I SAM-dependent methyltransferase [Planctomycetota bacterium]
MTDRLPLLRLTAPDLPAGIPPESDLGEILPIDAPWSSLPRGVTFERVRIEPLTNQLTMVRLRRAVHRASRLLSVGGELALDLRDPELGAGERHAPWPGTARTEPGSSFPEIHRPLRHYLELLRLFPLRPGTPRPHPADPSRLRMVAVRGEESPAARPEDADPRARYAPSAPYRRLDRLEEPEILDDLLYAWSRLASIGGERILSLGVNDGRELDLVREVFPSAGLPEMWGIDHAAEAIEGARRRFPAEAHRMLHADLAALATLGLPPFPVVVALGVLQCTTVDRDRLLADLKGLLQPAAGVLFSIPDCHFGADDLLRRPYDRRDPRADRGLVSKDIRYLVRWCHRAGFERVETFGTYDAFVLALRRGGDGCGPRTDSRA